MYTGQPALVYVLILNLHQNLSNRNGCRTQLVSYLSGSGKIPSVFFLFIIQEDKLSCLSLIFKSVHTRRSANQLAPVNSACLTCAHLLSNALIF